MDITSLATLVAMLASMAGMFWGLRREIHREVLEVRTELRELRTELKADIQRLDDRVYALATGLKPQLEDNHGSSQP